MYKLLGFVFLALAGLGVILPVLPTTPFLLLSAWFFARSSKKWHQWLLNSELFGPMLTNWETYRCISRRTKIVAVASMVIVGGTSLTFAMDTAWMRLLTGGLMTIGLIVVLRLRTCPADRPAESSEPELE